MSNAPAGPHRAVAAADMPWMPSPCAGVWRKRLQHSGVPESGRVTSLVRFDPGAGFRAHPHPDGEEILVLDGIFSDHTGDWGAGSFLLNPEGFSHAPYSAEGCLLLVQLRRAPGDRRQVALNGLPWPGAVGGEAAARLLYRQPGFSETIRLEYMPPGEGFAVPPAVPAELFVIRGALVGGAARYPESSWLSLSRGDSLYAGGRGALVYTRCSSGTPDV